ERSAPHGRRAWNAYAGRRRRGDPGPEGRAAPGRARLRAPDRGRARQDHRSHDVAGRRAVRQRCGCPRGGVGDPRGVGHRGAPSPRRFVWAPRRGRPVNITEVCLQRPVFAWMIMSGTILFGILAVMRIGVSQFPDVDNPTVSVGIAWPGASPEDVETGIINPIEDAISQVSGVITLSSSAKTGSARVTPTFDLSRNIDLALQDTQAKIAQVQRSLPLSSQAPVVSKSNPDDQPIMTVGISGPFARQLLADVARYQVQDMLETVPGVGQIQTMGYLDRNIRIWVDADKLVATGTTVTDVIS